MSTEDQFFDLAVQIGVLGYYVNDSDQKRCCDIIYDLLTHPVFQKWTKNLDLDHVEFVAWLIVKNAEHPMVADLREKLPQTLETLIQSIENESQMIELQLKKLEYASMEDLAEKMQINFQTLLEEKRQEIMKLEWKKLKLGK